MELNPFIVPKDVYIQNHYPRFARNPAYHHIPKVIEKEVTKDENGKKQVKERSKCYKDFGAREIDRILKFVVIFIDTESPYSEERNFDVRSRKCLKALQIKKDSFIHKEIKESGQLYNHLVFEFFKEINAHQYETWFSMKMNLHQMNAYLRSNPIADRNGNLGADINARRQLSSKIPEMLGELVDIEYTIFPDNRLQKIINDKSVQDSINGYAEQFALNPKYNA